MAINPANKAGIHAILYLIHSNKKPLRGHLLHFDLKHNKVYIRKMHSNKINSVQELNSDEFTIFSILHRLIKGVDIYSDNLKRTLGLTSSQLSCLLVVGDSDSISQNRLSQKVSLSPSMITGIVDQLEKRGLVSRLRNKEDRRILQISLTEEGKEVLKSSPLTFQKKLTESLKKLTKDERNQIQSGLNRLLGIVLNEVLLDSSFLSSEERLVDLEPAIIREEEEIKEKTEKDFSQPDEP